MSQADHVDKPDLTRQSSHGFTAETDNVIQPTLSAGTVTDAAPCGAPAMGLSIGTPTERWTCCNSARKALGEAAWDCPHAMKEPMPHDH
ncbi:hypothetical protein ACIBG0_20385 [Nocardia sp. NPDC050630]|uniref:hypothetical protein n=1 Tax=Nocardia sp. NPDC050630 TaxID=3364321 RepID=UPI0037B5A227